MAYLGIQRVVNHENAGTPDTIVHKTLTQSSAMVDVVEPVSQVRRDLHSRDPIRQNCEIRVSRVSETICEASAINVIVNEVNVVSRNRSPEELDQAPMVAFANHRQQFANLRSLDGAAELSLEDDHVFAADRAAPSGRGGGELLGKKIAGGGADFGDVVDVGILRQGLSDARKRSGSRLR